MSIAFYLMNLSARISILIYSFLNLADRLCLFLYVKIKL